MERYPWVVPCVAVPPGHRDKTIGLGVVVAFSHRLAVCHLDDGAPLPPLVALRDTIRARGGPTPDALAPYVARRLAADALLEPLRAQFASVAGEPTTPLRSRATYSRAFARYGAFDARDWRRLATLIRWFTAPDDFAVTLVTQGRLCRRYLALAPGIMQRRFCAWEHVLESALVLHGYSFTP